VGNDEDADEEADGDQSREDREPHVNAQRRVGKAPGDGEGEQRGGDWKMALR
jgi:hypothetical protein